MVTMKKANNPLVDDRMIINGNPIAPQGIVAQTFGQDAVMSALAGSGKGVEITEILKELFDKGKIFMITDLSRDEAIICTRIYMVAKMKGIQSWIDGLTFFCQIMLSVKRRSRKELIDSIIGYNKNMMDMANPKNWFGRRN